MKRRNFLLGACSVLAVGCNEANAASLTKIANGLDHPWGLAILPDGSLLVTEREGRLRRVLGSRVSDPIRGVPKVVARGQGGLLGIALGPDFVSQREVFLSFTEGQDGKTATAVFRGRLSDDLSTLEQGSTIFRQNVSFDSGQHFGSRLVFDREGHLFVTTGDRGSLRDKVQDPATHIGKVLRITKSGAPAPGNPRLPGWAPEVWSIGHRNLQGATLNPETGQLWTVEHGPRGGDELNSITAGKNYGWPLISYGREYSMLAIGEGTAKDGLEQPIHYWDPSIAPSGMAFISKDIYPDWKGSLLVGALAGQHVARLVVKDNKVLREEKLFSGVARFRDVIEAPDGRIYLLTDDSEPEGAIYAIAPLGEVTATTP